MDINFTWTITSIDLDLKIMSVEYSSEGYTTTSLTIPINHADQELEEHVNNFAPIGVWKAEHLSHATVEVGQQGVGSFTI